jgi:acetate kinase
MGILVVNCGSSSIKYKLYGMEMGEPRAVGAIDGLGTGEARHFHRVHRYHKEVAKAVPDYRSGVAQVVEALTQWGSPRPVEDPKEILGVGHRVVHGGEHFSESVVIDSKVMENIRALDSLAPLHNPANRAGIEAIAELLPQSTGVAVFDTAFFSTLPPRSYRYAVPTRWWRDLGVRRYGFHGISHRYLVEQAAALWGKPKPNMVTFHLGNGASACAVREGRAVDTSMGLTPLEGLVMGTRTGDIDPAVVFHLTESGMSLSEIRHGLEREGGLLGLSGVSSDFRQLSEAAESGDTSAAIALDVFAHRIRRYLGAFLAQVGRCDGVVFSGGIGENSALARRMVLSDLEPMGLVLDPLRNQGHGLRRISTGNSPIPIWVIPTDEESLIARDTARLVIAVGT